jgi:peptidoglycan-associated lipoprotein
MKSRFLAAVAVTVLCGTFSGCAKKVAANAPPAPYKGSADAPASSRSVTPQGPARSEVAANNERSRMPDAATRATIQELLNRIQDAYFDYDKHTLRPDAEAALKRDAQTLADIVRQYPDFKLTVEGHCDARGSEEYNLALGDARAKQAKEYLATLGLPENQLQLISYGKDRPVCNDQDEACWQKNRRAHLTQAQ